MAAIYSSDQVRSIQATDGRSALVRTPRIEVVAITSDDVLLEQIGQALDGESIIRHADSPAEAHGMASPRQPCVLLLDARGHDDLARVVHELQSPDGAHVVVVFAPAEAGDEVARAVRGSAAFAVLTIPVVQGQAAAVLAGACEESLARHALLAAPPAATQTGEHKAPLTEVPDAPKATDEQPVSHTRKHRASPAAGGNPSGPRTQHIVASLTIVLIFAAAGAWFWLHQSAPAPAIDASDSSPPVTTETDAQLTADVPQPEALQSGSVDDLLDSARAAMRERRYTDPEGQNALNYYRSVLAQDPGNGEALEGLDRVAAVLRDRVQAAVEQKRYDEANRTLAQLRSIQPADPAIARYEATVVDARIRRALDDHDVERARDLVRQASRSATLTPEAIARWQAELERQQGEARAEQLAELVSLRIRQGRLVDPASDNAKYYLAQLRRQPGNSQPRAALATTELQQAYLGKFKEALAKSQRAEAERWKTEARALGVTAAELTALQRDVTSRPAIAASKPETARVAQLIQDRIADNRLLEPAGDSALFHLNALRALDPSAPAIATSERALSAKLLEQGRAALTEKRLDAARTHAAAARQLGVNLDTVAALEGDITAQGAAIDAAKQQPAPRLVRTRYVAPEYPSAAFKQKLQGKVRVNVLVGPDGRVRDAAVVQADPPGVFDAAAVAAVRKWRFKSFGDEDSAPSATALVDITFQPEDAKQ